MFNKKENKWYKVAYKLYRKGKLNEPYNSLFDYYINLTLDSPYRKGSYFNHLSYFFHYNQEGQLETLSANLNSILPENLKDNFNKALEKFKKITDYDAEENLDMFDEEDDYVDDNSELLRKILKNHIELLEN